MTDEHDNKQGGCCGGHDSHTELKKEDNRCCQGKDDKSPAKNETEHSDNCCGSK